MVLKLGIVTPVVHMNPRFEPPGWEETGTLEDILEVAKAGDRCGMDWLSCSEHIAVPQDAQSVRGGRYWDPFTTLAVISQATERVQLLTHMIVLGYHHPLEIVKRLGTLDIVSNGRVLLGLGVGSLEKEFQVLGHTFEGRGPKSDDSMRAIRASWGKRTPAYEGSHYSFEGFVVDPSGLDREIQMWVGGRTLRSLRRAIELGDGWMPFRLTLTQLEETLFSRKVKELLEKRVQPLDMIFAPEPPIDPIGQREAAAGVMRSYVEVGATGLSLRFRHDSRSHFIEQMEAAVAIAQNLDH